MAIAGPGTGIWGFAAIEASAGLIALAGLASMSLRLWGAECLTVILRNLIWLLPVVPLALSREAPIIWTVLAILTGAVCLVVSYPALRPRAITQ